MSTRTTDTAEPQEQQSDAQELAEEMMEVEMATEGTYTVQGEVTNIDSSGGQITVTVELPTGEEKKRTFDRPQKWSDDAEFVQFVNGLGYDGAASIEQLPGTTCNVRLYDDEWEFAEMRTWRDRIGQMLSTVRISAVIGSGLVVAYVAAVLVNIPSGYDGALRPEFLIAGMADVVTSILLLVCFFVGMFFSALLLSPDA